MALKTAEVLKLPLADGGDGTVDVVKHYLNGKKILVQVNDPIFRPTSATYFYSNENQFAYIEMAEASGLKLLKDDERNCMQTSTYGTGELICDALKKGAKEIILGIGGSATNDGGIGMASALGYRFLDDQGNDLKPIGGNLAAIRKIDSSKAHPALSKVRFKVACDVSNPLYGDDGAAKVYGRQKGASEEEIELLDTGLRNLSQIIIEEYGIDLHSVKGSGAAGGIGGGAIVFLNGTLTSGIDLIKELADFDASIADADWIITGEGQLDGQTLSGKTIDGVIASAAKRNIPVAALCGSVDISLELQEQLGLKYVTSIIKGVTNLEQAMKSSYENLVYASYNFARLIDDQ